MCGIIGISSNKSVSANIINSLKKLDIPEIILEDSIFEYRPEQLSSSEFVKLTQIISNEPI